MANVTVRVNGETRTVTVEPDTPLFSTLRNFVLLSQPSERFLGVGEGSRGL